MYAFIYILTRLLLLRNRIFRRKTHPKIYVNAYIYIYFRDAVDCKNFPYYAYYIDDPNEKFDYNITIKKEKLDFRCTMKIIIYVIVVIIFIFANLLTFYQIRQRNISKILDKLREKFLIV